MESLISNRTWKLVDLPPGCKTTDCKWVLRKKLKPDGSIDKFKARLVAKGFKQKADLDISCKVVIYNYILYWLYSMTKSVVIALIYFLVLCGILLYWV